MKVTKGDKKINEGYAYKNVLGSWIHLHFASNPSMASAFVKSAENYRSTV
jgi:cobyrinic acid a,c-diamide synthase